MSGRWLETIRVSKKDRLGCTFETDGVACGKDATHAPVSYERDPPEYNGEAWCDAHVGRALRIIRLVTRPRGDRSTSCDRTFAVPVSYGPLQAGALVGAYCEAHGVEVVSSSWARKIVDYEVDTSPLSTTDLGEWEATRAVQS